MAISDFGNSYAAQSLGLSPQVTGGLDIAQALKTQLAEAAKRRTQPHATPAGAAAFDLFGPSATGQGNGG